MAVKENIEQKLLDSYDRWDYLLFHGGQDPFWPDGTNLNLVRNHILNYKSQLEEQLTGLEMPECYYRETPPEVSANYMAREEEIRKAAREALAVYWSDENFQYLYQIKDILGNETQKRTSIKNVLGYMTGLMQAIKEDSLVDMRMHEHYESYLESFRNCAGKIREERDRAMEENEQIGLFDQYEKDWCNQELKRSDAAKIR